MKDSQEVEMKILALDSSGIVASVAVVEDDTLLAEYTVNYKKKEKTKRKEIGKKTSIYRDSCRFFKIVRKR